MQFLRTSLLIYTISCSLTWASFQKFSCLSSLQKENIAVSFSIDEFAKKIGLSVEYEKGGDLVRLVDKHGKEMAYLEIQLEGKYHSKAPNYLQIKYQRVDPSMQNNKVSTALMSYAIGRYPNASGVYGTMAADNKAAIEKAKAEAKSLDEAIKETPFYKSLKKIGFTEISPKSTEAIVYLNYEIPPLNPNISNE